MNRIKNGVPTNASAIPESNFESFFLINPKMPSSIASGARKQAARAVMLFKELKVEVSYNQY